MYIKTTYAYSYTKGLVQAVLFAILPTANALFCWLQVTQWYHTLWAKYVYHLHAEHRKTGQSQNIYQDSKL